MAQRFFYKREPNPNWYGTIVDPMTYCFGCYYKTESEFKARLDIWNGQQLTYRYTAVPVQCVKKLFGDTNFGAREWPKEKRQ